MKLIAIDTNPAHNAYCVMDNGVPLAFGDKESSAFYAWLALQAPFVDHVVIEGFLSYAGKMGNTSFDSIMAVGRCQQIALQANVPVTLVTTIHQQKAICGTTHNANRAAMSKVLTQIYGGKGTKRQPGLLYGCSGHMWSALAVAHAFMVLFPLGDLDNETIERIEGAPEGEARERTRAERIRYEREWQAFRDEVEPVPPAVPDASKCPACSHPSFFPSAAYPCTCGAYGAIV